MADRSQFGAATNSSPFTDEEQSLPDRFEDQVRQYPDRIAVRGREQIFTYDALNKYANRIARAILALRGTGQETIGLILEKDAAMMAALMGVLKTAKIYVPLDPADPQARLSSILGDAQVSLVLTDNSNAVAARQLTHGTGELLNIDEIDPNLSEGNIGLPISPASLAYIIYTSGSTGQPKGVVQSHCNVLHKVKTYTNSFQTSVDDRLILLPSGSTGQATYNIYGALLNGAALYPFNVKEEGFRGLATWMRREEITMYLSTASLFRCFVVSADAAERYPSLRLIMLAGDQVFKKDVDLFKHHFSPDCVMVNALASTEAGIVRQFFITRETPIDHSVVPVGFPMEDIEISLLDGDRPVVVGSPGEIVIKSLYLTPGYWGKPELTEQTLVSDPAGGNKRIFRTGDLGRMTADGCLEYLGRKDCQVKIRGYKVETAEVEAAFLELDQVKQAAVVTRQNNSGEWHLVAYVAGSGSQKTVTAEELRLLLSKKLPEYMLPARFVFLDALPLTASGKVDLQALPATGEAFSEKSRTFRAPRDPIASRLTVIWEDILDVRPIGLGDNFFDLGGHSLAAMQIFAEIEKAFGRNFAATTIFDAPTVEKLASLFRQTEYGASTPVLLQNGSAGAPFFCVPGPRQSAFGYFELARALGSGRPVYGLVGPAEGGSPSAGPAFHTPKELAAHYIGQIRSVQAKGPYLLGGHSAGGVIAFEIAQQLQAEGHRVGLLALFDTLFPGYLQSLPSRHTTRAWKQKAFYQVRRFLGLNLEEKLVFIRGVSRDLKSQSIQRTAGNKGDLIAWRSRDYAPQPYSDRVTLFRARDSKWSRPYLDPDLGWSNVAMGGIDIYEVPGDHITMFKKPEVWSLAEKLKTCLERAVTTGTVHASAPGPAACPSEAS